MTGIAWAISAAIGFGIFQTLNRRAGQDLSLDPIRGAFMLIGISAVMLIIAALVTTGLDVLLTASPAAWFYFSLAGFIHFFVGWTLLGYSQNQIGAARTGAVLGSMPVFGLVIDLVLYRETFSPLALLGVGLVVVGVYIISFR